MWGWTVMVWQSLDKDRSNDDDTQRPDGNCVMAQGSGRHILIIEARFYEKLADELLAGTTAELTHQGASYDVVTVPGALEIPPTVALACDAGLVPYGATRWKYHGVVALGCVIRGETSHYETVSNESARGLMQIAMDARVPLGNGILTVENEAQAWDRARGGRANKGAGAAKACLSLVDLMAEFHGWSS